MNEETKNEVVETKEESKYRLRIVLSDEDTMFLRERSEPVTEVMGDNSGNSILLPDTLELIDALKKFVVENNGLGMAAVQLGVHQRLFVMRRPWNSDNIIAVVNPRIRRSEGMSKKTEGCFSIPTPSDTGALVKRPSMIWVDYTTDKGELIQEELLVGMDARVFQHELDHLDGKLMLDTDLPRNSGFVRWVRS